MMIVNEYICICNEQMRSVVFITGMIIYVLIAVLWVVLIRMRFVHLQEIVGHCLSLVIAEG